MTDLQNMKRALTHANIEFDEIVTISHDVICIDYPLAYLTIKFYFDAETGKLDYTATCSMEMR